MHALAFNVYEISLNRFTLSTTSWKLLWYASFIITQKNFLHEYQKTKILKLLSEKRWASRGAAIGVIFTQFEYNIILE